MKSPVLALLLLVCACLRPAFGHTQGMLTSPEDGATLDAVPEMLHVEFSESTRVVKITLTHTGPEGRHETRLDPPSREPVDALHLVPVFSGSGEYTLAWRALGVDGHVVTGSFDFSVR